MIDAVLGGVDARGLALLFRHVLNIAIVLLLVCLCYACGRTFIERLLPDTLHVFDDAASRIAFSVLCGLGLLGTTILITCSLLGVHGWSLALILLAPVPLVARAGGGLPRLLRSAWHEFAQRIGIAGQLVFVAAAGFMLCQSLAPATDWDALVYHLEVPKEFLDQRHVHVPGDNLHVAYVALLHMLYLPLMAFVGASAPALLNAMLAALVPLVMVAFSTRCLDAYTGRVSSSVLWGTTSLLLVASTARVDVTLSLGVFLGQYALFPVLAGRWSTQVLILSALCFGFAGGVKYSALGYLAATAPLVVWAIWRRAPRLLIALKTASGYAVVVFVCLSPWLVKNWVLLEAPLYPYLTERRLPGWLQEIAGSEHIPPTVDRAALRTYRHARQPFTIRDFLVAPGRLTVEPEGALYYTNVLLVLVFAVPLLGRDRRLVWLTLPPATYIALVVWMSSLTNVRYLLPAIPPLTMASVEVASRTSAWLYVSRRMLTAVAMCVALVPAAAVATFIAHRFRAPHHALGLISGRDYLSTFSLANVDDYLGVVAAVDAVAGKARVLMLFESRGFYFKSRVIQDNTMINWTLLHELGALDACLADHEIEYVIVNAGVVDYFLRRGVDLERARWDRFGDFANRCLTPVYETEGFLLYRVTESRGR